MRDEAYLYAAWMGGLVPDIMRYMDFRYFEFARREHLGSNAHFLEGPDSQWPYVDCSSSAQLTFTTRNHVLRFFS